MLKISHRDIVLRRGYMRVVRISEDRVRWFIIILPSADHLCYTHHMIEQLRKDRTLLLAI